MFEKLRVVGRCSLTFSVQMAGIDVLCIHLLCSGAER